MFGCFSRCHVVGAASGHLSFSQDRSSDLDRFCSFLDVSQDVVSLVSPRVTSLFGSSVPDRFADVRCFSRCRVVGAASGDLSVSHIDRRTMGVLAFSVVRSDWTSLEATFPC